jgi:hypothetical protein
MRYGLMDACCLQCLFCLRVPVFLVRAPELMFDGRKRTTSCHFMHRRGAIANDFPWQEIQQGWKLIQGRGQSQTERTEDTQTTIWKTVGSDKRRTFITLPAPT